MFQRIDDDHTEYIENTDISPLYHSDAKVSLKTNETDTDWRLPMAGHVTGSVKNSAVQGNTWDRMIIDQQEWD